jgi:hypothetical protein
MDIITNNAPYVAVVLASIVGFCGYLLGHQSGASKAGLLMLDMLEQEGAISFDKDGNLVTKG